MIHFRNRVHTVRSVLVTFDLFEYPLTVDFGATSFEGDSTQKWNPQIFTTETGEPTPSALVSDTGGPIYDTAWLKFAVASGDGFVALLTPSVSADCVFAIWQGTAINALTEIFSYEYNAFQEYSPWLDPGDYYIQVGFSTPSPTVFGSPLTSFGVRFTRYPQPQFDDLLEEWWSIFAEPSTTTPWSSYGDGTPAITLTHATVSPGEPVPSVVPAIYHTAWLQYVQGEGEENPAGTITLDTTGSDVTLNPVIAIYDGPSSGPDAYTDLGPEIASGLGSVSFTAATGGTYWVQVGCENESDYGDMQLNVTTP